MNFGFNSNVRVGKDVYHVQTEDRGPSHPYLDTVVYAAGRVVHKRSTSYEDLKTSTLHGEALEKKLHERLSQQHHEVMAQLEAGTLEFIDHTSPKPKKPAAAPAEGLEIHLLNPKTWLASGMATLEIEVCRKGAAATIGGADIVAFLEGKQCPDAPVKTRADEQGRATLMFRLPSATAGGTSLVIRAKSGAANGELRFRLKGKSQNPAPASSST
jgi:hypothetical protein